MAVERSGTLAAAAALVLAGCAAVPPAAPDPSPRVVQAGAPGEAARPADPYTAGPRHSAADVEFMRHMIAHHVQAMEMAEMVPERSANPEVRLLARRIQMAQGDELALMRRWLSDRGEAEEADAAHHHHHHPGDHQGAREDPHAGMPGMLSPAQLERLRSARGPEFDRLFLAAMIFHHEGALLMVEELFATPGAGQESEIYQFAAHVDSDQRIEISRMYRMLAALTQP
jgi:uncharacterized protein (DUF305 family)